MCACDDLSLFLNLFQKTFYYASKVLLGINISAVNNSLKTSTPVQYDNDKAKKAWPVSFYELGDFNGI